MNDSGSHYDECLPLLWSIHHFLTIWDTFVHCPDIFFLLSNLYILDEVSIKTSIFRAASKCLNHLVVHFEPYFVCVCLQIFCLVFCIVSSDFASRRCCRLCMYSILHGPCLSGDTLTTALQSMRLKCLFTTMWQYCTLLFRVHMGLPDDITNGPQVNQALTLQKQEKAYEPMKFQKQERKWPSTH